MKLLYEGEKVGSVVTNRSLTLQECIDLCGINIDEKIDENTPRWDYEKFEMDYEEEMDRIELINDKYGIDFANETQPVCESAKSDKVLENKKLSEFSDEFLKLKNNGEIWGVYYQDSKLVAQTINNELITDILYEE